MAKNPRRNPSGTPTEKIALGFANLSASVGDHIGHFFQTSEEWRAVLIPFLKEGISLEANVLLAIPQRRNLDWEDV